MEMQVKVNSYTTFSSKYCAKLLFTPLHVSAAYRKPLSGSSSIIKILSVYLMKFVSYMAFLFITFFHILFGSIFYHYIYGYMFLCAVV